MLVLMSKVFQLLILPILTLTVIKRLQALMFYTVCN